jgi:RDD family protein
VVTWDGARVSTHASIAVARPLTGAKLRDAYGEAVTSVTFGAARMRGNSVVLGPLTLLRFGTPKVTRSGVDWPIEGGLLAGAPGGRWRVQASGGRVEATVTGYTPRLPKPVYSLTHLHVHQLFTRLYLLRLRGREPAPGAIATRDQRFRAGSVDAALCLTLARRPARFLAVAAVYHVVCWSLWGRTLGGLVTRQRVVAVDGSRLTPAQSLLRFVLLPVSWFTGRPLHDELVGSEVIRD